MIKVVTVALVGDSRFMKDSTKLNKQNKIYENNFILLLISDIKA